MAGGDWSDELAALCRDVAGLLATRGWRIVLAESCTAGLTAAALAGVPGISRHLCGSAVAYRDDTKTRWLGVPREMLAEHTAVSAPVAQQMAVGALANTPEADLALSVTGHLGPDAPVKQDGLVFVGVAVRGEPHRAAATEVRLRATDRLSRQQEAAVHVLRLTRAKLEETERQGGRTAGP